MEEEVKEEHQDYEPVEQKKSLRPGRKRTKQKSGKVKEKKTLCKEYEDEKEDLNEFMTENNYYITKYLNSTKDKLTFNAYTDTLEDCYYSKEYTYEDILKINRDFFQDEGDLENINYYISKSIKYEIAIAKIIEEGNKLELKIKLITKAGGINTNFVLDKISISKEQFLIKKINFLLQEKKDYLEGIKLKKLTEEKKEENLISRINYLEKKINSINNNFLKVMNINLITCCDILNNLDDWKLIGEQLKKIDSKYNNILLKLVYRATRDGDLALNFHSKCDDIGPNITLVRTIDNCRFGGFTVNNWKHFKQNIKKDDGEIGTGKEDKDAFCFSLDLYKVYPNCQMDKEVIFCCNKYGPTFLGNIFCLNDKMLEYGGYSLKKKDSYFDGQDEDYEISGGKRVFGVKEVEVLEIIFV